jgi:hypothetical protein
LFKEVFGNSFVHESGRGVTGVSEDGGHRSLGESPVYVGVFQARHVIHERDHAGASRTVSPRSWLHDGLHDGDRWRVGGGVPNSFVYSHPPHLIHPPPRGRQNVPEPLGLSPWIHREFHGAAGRNAARAVARGSSCGTPVMLGARLFTGSRMDARAPMRVQVMRTGCWRRLLPARAPMHMERAADGASGPPPGRRQRHRDSSIAWPLDLSARAEGARRVPHGDG